MNLVLIPWRITDYDGTGIVSPGPDHIGFKVESIEALKADLAKIASGNPDLEPRSLARSAETEARRKMVAQAGGGGFQMADNDNVLIDNGPGAGHWFDKVPSKFSGWSEADFRAAGFRAVPGSVVRRGAHVAKGAILMPSFVNIGAYVGEGTMVDTWATVGSCAQIGKNVHLSGGAGIGGVLEPLQADPVIIEDGAFIGARAEVAEGVRVGEGAVLSMGVYLGASTKIIDRETGETFRGEVPPYAVVVPGSTGGGNLGLYCAVIVKRVDARTRSKTSINELLRD